MTIALGLVARDGVVLAADTEMTAGNTKFNHGKLSATLCRLDPGSPRRQFIFGAAGTLDLSRTLVDRLRGRINAEPEIDTKEAFRSQCETILGDFHAQHVAPFAAYPAYERPGVDLLVGMLMDRADLPVGLQQACAEVSLICGTGTTCTREEARAIGIGAEYASSLLARMYQHPRMDVWHTILLAAYVVYLTKQSVCGCGGETDIWALRRDGLPFVVLDRQSTRAVDAIFSDYCNRVEPTGLREVIGAEPPSRALASSECRVKLTTLVAELKAKADATPDDTTRCPPAQQADPDPSRLPARGA